MAAGRVVVRPVDHAALGVVFVFAGKAHRVAALQTRNARREVDIVCHQYGLAVGEFHDETLVARALGVVGQGAVHFAAAAHLHIAALLGKGLGNQFGAVCRAPLGSSLGSILAWRARLLDYGGFCRRCALLRLGFRLFGKVEIGGDAEQHQEPQPFVLFLIHCCLDWLAGYLKACACGSGVLAPQKLRFLRKRCFSSAETPLPSEAPF